MALGIALLIFLVVIPVYYLLMIMTLINIVKRGNRTGWLIFCIISFVLPPIGVVFLITYWTEGKKRVKEKTYMDKAKINVNIDTDLKDVDKSIHHSKGNFCSDCGAKTKKGAKFCPDCGAKQ